MDRVKGIIIEILREDQKTGRLFLTMQYESGDALSFAKMGVHAPGLRAGDAFVADGEWRQSRFQGRLEEIFEARSQRPELPSTQAAAERLLTGIFGEAKHGITADAARRFVDRHGPAGLRKAIDRPEILLMMSSDPQRFRDAIFIEWDARTKGGRAVALLEASGLENRAIGRIVAAWRDEAFDRLKQNPYQAVRIPHVSFVNADLVGRHLGFDLQDRSRIHAAVSEVLRAQEARGSTAADLPTLLAGMGDVSGIERATLKAFLEDAAKRSDHDLAIYVTGGEPICASLRLYCAETDVVTGVYRLLCSGRRNQPSRVRAAAERLFASPSFARFDPVQRCAVMMAATEPVSIVTGGPGTGKSTVMEAVAILSEHLDIGPLFLASPTGMAAKRLSVTTKRKASTVHRLLKAVEDPATGNAVFKINKDNPLPGRCFVVVDEAWMLDVEAMAALINAMPEDGRLLLVGDRDQLPSVGPGMVASDLLFAEVGGRRAVPSISLVNSYRADKDSGIPLGAAKIRAGQVPDMGPDEEGGVSFRERPTENIVDEIEKVVSQELIARGIDPLRDLAILCPQGPGSAGAWEINRRLSARLNPSGAPIPGVAGGPDDDANMPLPRVGDRVMLTRNDIENDVMNGDIGFIVGTSRSDTGRMLINVRFDCGVEVAYPVSRWRSLILAYAWSIHRSQGSEYPMVVMPMTMAHARMLGQTLIYTGWTRARAFELLVGEHRALEHAVTNRGPDRMTLTRRFLEKVSPLGLYPPDRPDWESIAAQAQAACAPPIRPAASANIPVLRLFGRLKPKKPVASLATNRVVRRPFGGAIRRPAAARPPSAPASAAADAVRPLFRPSGPFRPF